MIVYGLFAGIDCGVSRFREQTCTPGEFGGGVDMLSYMPIMSRFDVASGQQIT
ncbi:hypothetical protein GCM10010297_40310 [Streptomyces malachitofuscus]|nr:hypothetical protein GCM10010297_40310 [Streptomyces malachitofuscus]